MVVVMPLPVDVGDTVGAVVVAGEPPMTPTQT